MKKVFSIALMLALAAGISTATNGYFSHGYGTPYMAMAGAGSALSLSSLGAAVNPAAVSFMGNRYDLGLALFNPDREFAVTGEPSGYPGTFGLVPGIVTSDSKHFPIPSLGMTRSLNERLSFGLAVYGNGGMNTNYPTAAFYGTSPTGVNLSQLFVAPTLSMKVTPDHAVGISPIFAYQYFKAEGLQAFSGFSENPSKLSNNKTDGSLGFGVRVGYQGHWAPFLSVGASYQTRIAMGDFKEYAGLFAESGGFDIPANWTVGVALHPMSDLTVALDVQQIYYSDIPSVANPFDPAAFFMGKLLGGSEGAGFGWEDMTVYKGGLQWSGITGWDWRVGYSYGSQPIPESEVLFNILAPGVIEQHLTFGFSRGLGGSKQLHLAVMHAFSNDVSGPNPMEVPGLQAIQLKMSQWLLELGFSF